MSLSQLLEAAFYTGTTCKFSVGTARCPTPNSWSATCWAYQTGNSATYYDLVAITDTNNVIGIGNKFLTPNYFLNLGDLNTDQTSSRILPPNEWHHYAITVIPNGANTQVFGYVDGVLQVGPVSLVASTAGSSTLQLWNSRASTTDAGSQWTGHACAFKVWDNVQLTEREIRREMLYWRAVKRQGLFLEMPCWDIDSRAQSLGGSAMDLQTLSGTFATTTGPDPAGLLRNLPVLVRHTPGKVDPILLRPPGTPGIPFSPGRRPPFLLRPAQLLDATPQPTQVAVSGAAVSGSISAGSLTGTGALQGAALSASIDAAALTGAGALQGAALSVSEDAASLLGLAPLAGASLSASAGAANIGGLLPASGAAVSASTAAGSLTGSGALAGASLSATIDAGSLTGSGALAGASLSASIDAGALTGSGALTGASLSATTGPGLLAVSSSGSTSGASLSSSVSAAALTGALALTGTAVSSSAASASLTGSGALAGAAVSASTAVGDAPAPTILQMFGAAVSASMAVLDSALVIAGVRGGGFPDHRGYDHMLAYLRQKLEAAKRRKKKRTAEIKRIQAEIEALEADEEDAEALTWLI